MTFLRIYESYKFTFTGLKLPEIIFYHISYLTFINALLIKMGNIHIYSPLKFKSVI
jgi:hypothetical protein